MAPHCQPMELLCPPWPGARTACLSGLRSLPAQTPDPTPTLSSPYTLGLSPAHHLHQPASRPHPLLSASRPENIPQNASGSYSFSSGPLCSLPLQPIYPHSAQEAFHLACLTCPKPPGTPRPYKKSSCSLAWHSKSLAEGPFNSYLPLHCSPQHATSLSPRASLATKPIGKGMLMLQGSLPRGADPEQTYRGPDRGRGQDETERCCSSLGWTVNARPRALGFLWGHGSQARAGE